MILTGIGVGIGSGLAFNALTKLLQRETEGALIVLIFASLTLVFGTIRLFGGDELLGTLSMGTMVANYNPRRKLIFKMLERYTEELIFALFFTLSGMLLDMAMMGTMLGLISAFVLLRGFGKWLGSRAGAAWSQSSQKIKRHLFWGLLPQGGIVIGLALLLKSHPDFADVADTVMSVTLGATVIHEIIGPLLARRALQQAGEISD
jgi:Kef-type K+ transport system membrane component KefB